MKRALKTGLYVAIGILACVGVIGLVFGGALAGTFIFISKATPKAHITYPAGDGKEIIVDLAEGIPSEEIKRMLEEGEIKGHLLLLGPGNIKLLDSAMTVKIPVEKLTSTLVDSLRKELGLEEGEELSKALSKKILQSLGIEEGEDLSKVLSSKITESLGLEEGEELSAVLSDKVAESMGLEEGEKLGDMLKDSIAEALGTGEKDFEDVVKDALREALGIEEGENFADILAEKVVEKLKQP